MKVVQQWRHNLEAESVRRENAKLAAWRPRVKIAHSLSSCLKCGYGRAALAAGSPARTHPANVSAISFPERESARPCS
ncbi:hypothetical protein BH160DRAFT_1947 [Burkholderia sp. H160]|nr:hypothetical protein BH160DRAFT_1947 [Burkholderia sp. H160]